jgi:hypothetical protein
MSLSLHAGTIRQVFNETYAQSSALATIDPVTPPPVDESYLVTVYEDRTGDWVRPNLDEVGPYISWTDDLGAEQWGNGHSLASGPQNIHRDRQPKILKMVQHSGQPGTIRGGLPGAREGQYPLTIPYSSPDHFTYNVSVQVQGG